MGLFSFMNDRVSQMSKAPDFLGRAQGGELFGGMGDASRGLFGKIRSGGFGEPEPAPSPQVTTRDPLDPEPPVDMDFSGGKPIFDRDDTLKANPFEEGEYLVGRDRVKDEPRAMYPAIPNNGDPNAPKQGPAQPMRPMPMPGFNMMNPISNMFGMGQMMNPFMGNNPFMGMMSMMFQPMMQMMQMFNPFMNPFGMGGGGFGGGYGPGFGGALPQLFPMPQQRMPFRPRIPYSKQPLIDRPDRAMMDRFRDMLDSRLGTARPINQPNYGAFLNPDGSDFGGIRTMDFQDRDGDGIDDRYQRGPSTDMYQMADRMMQDRVRNLSPYTISQEDNMAISDNSDPQGEAEAKQAVQRALAGPQRGLIGSALSRLFG